MASGSLPCRAKFSSASISPIERPLQNAALLALAS
jgi:hypothetical protein